MDKKGREGYSRTVRGGTSFTRGRKTDVTPGEEEYGLLGYWGGVQDQLDVFLGGL
jgi:hypothetical protein